MLQFYFQMGFPQQAGYYLPAAIPQPQRFIGHNIAAVRGGQPRWQQPRGGGPQYSNQVNPGAPMGQNQIRGGRGPNPRMAQVPRPMMTPMPGMRPGMPPQAMQGGPAANNNPNVRANYKYSSGVRNAPNQQVVSIAHPQVMPQPPQPQPAVFIQGQEPLTASMLAQAPPNEQKQMLGERLFPLIQSMHPDLAGKITGMLLEIDNSELVHMLEHQESLKSKVEEAVAVLQAHKNTNEN